MQGSERYHASSPLSLQAIHPVCVLTIFACKVHCSWMTVVDKYLLNCTVETDTGEGSYYDGWSSFNALKKRVPGLVDTEGRGPMHCYLTPEVSSYPCQPLLGCQGLPSVLSFHKHAGV